MRRNNGFIARVAQRFAHSIALALLVVQLGAAWHAYDFAAHRGQAPHECAQCLGAHGAAQGHVADESVAIAYGADFAPLNFSSASAASKAPVPYHSRAPPV